ncbi:MAG: DinB family protein [Pirellulaceae bacterium]
MDAGAALKQVMGLSDMVSFSYLEDLTDDQLMLRPHTGCNHLNWQVGHLISSENHIMESAFPGSMPKLPEGFSERYAKETASSNDASAFLKKDELIRLAKEQRMATIAKLDTLDASDLDQPSPEAMRAYAPSIGAVFALLGTHWMMHCGQWVVVRRELGKPALF